MISVEVFWFSNCTKEREKNAKHDNLRYIFGDMCFGVNVTVRVLWRVILWLSRAQLRVLMMSVTEGAISERKTENSFQKSVFFIYSCHSLINSCVQHEKAFLLFYCNWAVH